MYQRDTCVIIYCKNPIEKHQDAEMLSLSDFIYQTPNINAYSQNHSKCILVMAPVLRVQSKSVNERMTFH